MPTLDAEGKRMRLAHAATYRARWIAWTGSLLLHAIVLGAALLIVLKAPERQEQSVEVVLQRNVKPGELRDVPAPEETTPAVRTSRRPLLPRPELPLPAAPPDIVISTPLPEPSEAQNTFELPSSPLDRKWTPEEAYAELTRLLEEYPQFREQVLREMIAGKGFVPDTVQHIDLFLDKIFANGIKPSWGNQRQAVEGASRSFDGVSGWRQNSNYGTGINVIGLLKFLYDLIDGE